MKSTHLIAGVAAIGLLAAGGAALAHGKKGAMRGFGPLPAEHFAQADTDGDGKLTPAEIEAHAKARFDAADSDGNGALSQAEMKAAAEKRAQEMRSQRAARMVSKMIERHDENGDGELSYDEMPGQKSRAEAMFDRLDADGDGAVSREEMEAAREKFAERRGMGQHGKRWKD